MNLKKQYNNSINFVAKFILQHFNSDISFTTFCAKMPLKDGFLSPQLMQKCLESNNFKSSFVKRSIDELNVKTLPCVAFRENGEAFIITHIDTEANSAIIYTEKKEAGIKANLNKLKEHVCDEVLLIRKTHTNNESVSFSWFWGTLKRFKPLWVQVALASLLINCFALVAPLFTMNVYDRVIPNRAEETLWVLFTGVLIVYIFDFIMKNLRAYFIDVAGRGADVLISAKIFEHFQNIKLGSKTSSAGAMSHQMKEFESLRDFLTSASISALVDLPFILLFILVLSMIGGQVALVLLAALPISLIVAVILQKKIESTTEQAWSDQSQKNNHLVETLSALESIKSLNMEQARQSIWESYVGATSLNSVKARYYMNMANSFASFMQQMTTVCVITWGVYIVNDGNLSLGGLIACSMIAGRVIAPVGTMVALSMRYSYAKHAYIQLNEFMKQEVDTPENKTFLNRSNITGVINCNNITFKYPASEQPTIKGLNFSISAGEKVAILGRSGSGKSTFARLLNNLYSINDGQILIDGTDINQIHPSELRQQILLVPQTPQLFFGTLRENLKMVNPFATEQELIHACKLVGLTNLIKQHPQGIDLHLGEAGDNLSGGQKQAICLARALLKKPKLIILDEPTSHMDSIMEKDFSDALENILSQTNIGLVLITHKHSMLKIVDRIAVMDKGRFILDKEKSLALKDLSGEVLTIKQKGLNNAS